MKFKSKLEVHNKGTELEISKVIAHVEFSEGDLVELQEILSPKKYYESDWGYVLLRYVNTALKKKG